MVKLVIVLNNGRIEARRNNFNIVKKVIEEKYFAIKELSNRLEGYYTCTRVLLERINYKLVEHQRSSVEDNVGSYEIKVDELVRIIDLLESNLNQYFHQIFAVDVKSC